MSARRELRGLRVVVTGAARGIGAALAARLHERGDRVALLGLEDDRSAELARSLGDAPWRHCESPSATTSTEGSNTWSARSAGSTSSS